MDNDEKPKRVVGKPFQKGVSGNPGGRPPTIREVRELAQKMSKDVLLRLYDILMDTKCNPMACVAAGKEIMDRAQGKAVQTQLNFGTMDGDIISDGDISGLTALLARAKYENEKEKLTEH